MKSNRCSIWIVLISFFVLFYSTQPVAGAFADSNSEADTPTYNQRDSHSLDTCSLTFFEKRLETEHFVLKWTNNSSHEQDNIPDPGIISETASYLEVAWQKYVDIFGRKPFLAPGKSKIDVEFRDLDCFGEAGPPEGPIRLDSENWVKLPGIRKPTSAHELFHKLQYAFGYRTKWRPKSPFKWFTEGTAAWSEVFVWQQVSGSYKVKQLFAKPEINLYDSEDCALPFWVFFETQYQNAFHENPMVAFLREYEAIGNERVVLNRMIKKMFDSVDTFFAMFSLERQLGSWRQPPGGQYYASISGPDGNHIVPKLNVTEVPVKAGERLKKSGSIAQLGSGYYRFKLPRDAEGRTVTVSVSPSSGYSCSLGWEKSGKWNQRIATPVPPGAQVSETIDLTSADSLMLIICGKEKGGKYSIDISVN